MPNIIAICPYCRAGGVRAPDTAIGASATCPKCKSSFSVLPEDNLPDWAANAKAGTNSFSAPSPKKPDSSPLAETHATAAMPDVTEPSPVLPAEKESKAKKKAKTQESSETPKAASQAATPAPAAVVISVPEEESSPAAPANMGMVFALLALILVGPAVLVSQLPFGRVIALPLAGLGLLAGLLCLGAEGKARLAGAGAAFLHFSVLILLLFLPSWLNLDPWSGAPITEDEKNKIPVVVEHGTGNARPASANDWIEAGRSSWQFRDIRVTVNTTVGPATLNGPNGAKRTTRESYFHVVVKVANIGSEREIPLSGWAAGQDADGMRVTTAEGKELKLATFEAGWSVDRGKPAPRAVPGSTSEVRWLFATPTKTDSMRIQLSGAAIGVESDIKFRALALVIPIR